MTKSIKVSNYIKSGFSSDDAAKINDVIDATLSELEPGGDVVFDFSGVKFFTTRFFNLTLARLLNEMSFTDYSHIVKIVNLSDVGQVAYQHSLDNAKRQLSMSPEEKDARFRILEKLLQDK